MTSLLNSEYDISTLLKMNIIANKTIEGELILDKFSFVDKTYCAILATK